MTPASRWGWPASCARRICRRSARAVRTSPACDPPPAWTGAARPRSTPSASRCCAPCVPRRLHARRPERRSAVGPVDRAQAGPDAGRGSVELGRQRFALEPGERLLARRDGRGGVLASGRVEVVAGADRGEPLLMAGEVGVGFLELGVRGAAAAALELKLLMELPGALDHLAVLI